MARKTGTNVRSATHPTGSSIRFVPKALARGRVSFLVADAAHRVTVEPPHLDEYVRSELGAADVLTGAGLNLDAGTPPEDVVEAGFPASVVRDFGAASGLSATDVGLIVGASVRTMARKLAKNDRLDAAESDRAYRLFHAVARAVHSFGDVEKALRWLQRSVPSLGGRKPIELLRTEIGTRDVLSALDRIAYGGVT
ncbi:MAG TPA: antitoxin Xre/MbcA/ParS toxin-binding domain-containing protein [Candidatus Elarobacter sp.]|nr:antitoxin Xre/MbcA/ParS toxin-binding domain-containing protein [Candidatus Elarobacter sp.]